MRSIRQSLTAYLLVLLAVTLGVVGLVIDQLTRRTLEAREQAATDLVEARYQDQCRAERKRVDEALLSQARELGAVMQTEYYAKFPEFNLRTGFIPLGLLQNPLAAAAATAGTVPARDRTSGAWHPNPIRNQLTRPFFLSIEIDDRYLAHVTDDDTRSTDYFQINRPITIGAGRETIQEWHSKSLAGRSLPFDAKAFDPGKVIEWSVSDSALAGGESVRRVVFKTPLYTSPPDQRGGPRPSGPGGPGGPGGRGPGGPPQPGGPGVGQPRPPTPAQLVEAVPKIYIQCARPLAVINKEIKEFDDDRREELANLRRALDAERTQLRVLIGSVATVAFLAVALGGPWLVGRGLRPVGELSEAVSRVSEKDFLLPHDGSALPAELGPIHTRLTQTLDQLRRAFDREKQSVADISHELRTPIASLMATIDVALRKPRTPDQYRTTLEECRLISKQLSQLVERIMTLASLDSGNDRVSFSRVDAAELAAGCVAVIRPLAAAHGITVHLKAEPVEFDTDAAKLREVLMNLLHNAVEYNRPDGRVDLTVTHAADTGKVVFEVRDNGIGMTPEVREKIFERFYRADASRHATGIHAGLGLAIVKEYVSRLKGTITVESEPDVGTTFRVEFPAAIADPKEQAPIPISRPARQAGTPVPTGT